MFLREYYSSLHATLWLNYGLRGTQVLIHYVNCCICYIHVVPGVLSACLMAQPQPQPRSLSIVSLHLRNHTPPFASSPAGLRVSQDRLVEATAVSVKVQEERETLSQQVVAVRSQ